MIKIYNLERNVSNNSFFNNEELFLLEKLNIDSNLKIIETYKKINNYICDKYNLLGIFQVEDVEITEQDRKILKLCEKILNNFDRLT